MASQNNRWNSVVFIKTDGSKTETKQVSEWPGVKAIWSASGAWDWVIQLDEQYSSPEKTEEFVAKLRNLAWIRNSESNWWRQVYWAD